MLAALLCAGCFAQSTKDIISKYKDKQGAESLNVGSVMMGLVKLIVPDGKAKEMMKPFCSIHMVNLDECSDGVKGEFAVDAKKLKTKGYDELMRVNDNEDRVVVYTKQKGDRIKDCLVVSTGESCFLVHIKGDASMKDIDHWITENARR